MAKQTRFGIIGAGHIAAKFSKALNYLRPEGIIPYAIASRDLAKARDFANANRIDAAYGSYEEMLADPQVDVVYIATPNHCHLPQSLMCLEHGKHVLCEKPFCANAAQAEIVFAEARKRGLHVTEAIWTRFMPCVKGIRDIIASGETGAPKLAIGYFGAPIGKIPRIERLEYAGGGLLDLGIYPITFAMLYFGEDFSSFDCDVTLAPSGVDETVSLTLNYPDGRMAMLGCSTSCMIGDPARICCESKWIELDQMLRCEKVSIRNRMGEFNEIAFPFDCNGYEYEARAVARAIGEGKLECEEAPWEFTLKALRLMDAVRAKAGIRFPFE